MNAKKIMGAVLVAFLAAALLVGAGAAQTVFVYENLSTTQKTGLEGTWSNGDAYVTIGDNDIVVPSANFVPGTYKNGDKTLFVTNPTAIISGVVGTGYEAYSFIGGNLFQGTPEEKIVITNQSASANVTIDGLYVTFPDGTSQKLTVSELKTAISEDATLGLYKVQALFNYTNFTAGLLMDKLLSEAVTFTIVEEGAATISVAADSVLKSEPILLTITGQPGKLYNVTFDHNYLFNATEKQLIMPKKVDGGLQFTMPNTGKLDLSIEYNTSSTEELESSEKISVDWFADGKDKKKSVVINFAKGTITAKTDADAYFIGDTIKVSGTNTAGSLDYYYINGTNFKMTGTGSVPLLSGVTKTGDNFEFEIDTTDPADIKSTKLLDVGTYTLTIVTTDDAKVTVPLVLKQPFISIISAPEVIVQGEDEVEFIINAEAANKIAYYIFGTNYFVNKSDVNTHVTDDEGEAIENQFKIVLLESDTEAMDAGQYFMVIQHPMYDTNFNILSEKQAIYLNTSGQAKAGTANTTELFKVDMRQTANAAQALCDALDSQSIDDMYVKYSFFVVGEDESFTISEIPTTIAQGETLTISGVSTANAEKYVTVEMISTAFAAVPKENVGSAAFIAVTTQVAEDGTWEVTFDTSNLNVDEYSLKVACGEDTWKNVNINVVEAADKPDTPDTPDVPDTPDTPDTPTEPTTPGFGALAALAGLGAVAVLLLRRE